MGWIEILIGLAILGFIILIWWVNNHKEPDDTEKDNMMFIRPKNCHYCTQGYKGLYHSVNYAENKNKWDIIDIKSTSAVKSNIYNKIDLYKPYSIYGFGHGSPSIYTGDDERPILTTIECSKTSGKVVYLLSCLTANFLGPAMIANGTKSYAGFNISWTWISNGSIIGDPYNDKYAKGFYESSNELWKALCDGYTFKQALSASVAKYNYWINYWYNSSDSNKNELIKWLAHDRDGLVGLGDMSATL